MADFHSARRAARMEQILSRLSGRSADLLSYERVRRQLKARGRRARVRREIPLNAIAGSVDRYDDFTRSFLPKSGVNEEGWARVEMATTGMKGLPPIEVYQIGQVYFVLDGNHRVSVARQFGADRIDAYVTELQTRVPLTPDVQPDELILKAEYVDFLERTNLDKLRPEAHLEVTAPGQYRKLLEHIDVHRYFMGQEQERDIPYSEAVTHWYDTVYRPLARFIHEQGILGDFPGRTETDLYLWIMDHRAALTEEVGWEVKPKTAAADLAERFSTRPQHVAGRIVNRIVETVTPQGLSGTPTAGGWRQEHRETQESLFEDILVAIDGRPSGWRALSWAVQVAQRERSRLYGLHVVSSAQERDGEAVQALRAEFERRAGAAGVQGKVIASVGHVSRVTCQRARLMDLTVLSLSYPYAAQPIARLGSGLHSILRRCPTPVALVPRLVENLERVLLSYDGSDKAREALYVATYMAGQWQVELKVLVVNESTVAAGRTLREAEQYLSEHGVQAQLVTKRGSAGETILSTAEEWGANLILMGGYGAAPLIETAVGSTIEQVLRATAWPVLICQ